MGKLIDVVYDAEGTVIALGYPAPAHDDNVQHESGPVAGSGHRVAQWELPPQLTRARHPELSRLRVDTKASPHRIVLDR
jgi:hypothetical protein